MLRSITSTRRDWDAAQPPTPTKDDPAKQWEGVVSCWKQPKLNAATFDTRDVSPPKPGMKADDAAIIPVVESVIAAWSGAFGWDHTEDRDKSGGANQLKSEQPELLWDQLEQLYMAAPLVSV